MKSKFTLGLLAVGVFSVGAFAACGKKEDTPVVTEFSFTVSLSNGNKTLNKGEEAQIIIDETGGDGTAREYSYSSNNTSAATVSATGKVTAKAKGDVKIIVNEAKSGKSQMLSLTITDATPASGGFNYASLAGEQAIKTRTEILGQLEKYAMDNHLTGITLFENGGYVKYSKRVSLPTENYITGYGFGLLSEGEVLRPMSAEAEENANHRMYLHSALSQDPKTINARNDTGSQVSDLEGYITSSFWGTKLNSTKDQYVWYPVLAKDSVTFDGVTTPFERPLPVYADEVVKPGEDPNPLGLYNTWRIYVKTGTDGGIKYRYQGTSWGTNFDGRGVTIADYEFAYRLLLTGSHNLKRGPEMAGDQTYGIVGALKYNNNTKNATDEGALALWNDMKAQGQLGIKTGNDTNGDYIQLTILNPIDRFTAMYTLSSNLLSPMPEEFISTIGEGSVKEGAQRYGAFNNNDSVPAAHRDNILDYTICVGPYMLEGWTKNQVILFKKNDQWNEPNRYKIAGIKMIYIDTSTSTTAVYDRFYDEDTGKGKFDNCGIPTKYIKQEAGNPLVRKTKGDATFKLNVNSCTQDTWNELFGPQGKINKNSNWEVKPWMSNDNFLNGLFYSIDRNTFAGNRGVQPSISYFSDAYLNDPENGGSYNSTEAHKNAIAAYQTYDSNGNPTYGYSKDRAILAFRSAVKELVAQKKLVYGTAANPQIINIHIKWMYQTDTKEYGEEIAGYFESAFNDPKVCEGRIKLEVTQDAVTNWQDVYNEYLMKGQFDLGFGAISGNTYNPLNFMEVLKSDNSSGFTLNWGTDTSKITQGKPLIYQDKMWSFDALWAVADHGGVVDNGSVVKSVKKCFMVAGKNDFYNGLNFMVPVTFIDVDTAKLEVSRLQLYVYGSGGYDLPYTVADGDEPGQKILHVTLTPELANEINTEMRRVNKMDDPDKERLWNETPFTYENYGVYWELEVSYTLSISAGEDKWGTPSESYVSVAKNEASWIDD